MYYRYSFTYIDYYIKYNFKKSHSSGLVNGSVPLDERSVWANLKCLWGCGMHSGFLHWEIQNWWDSTAGFWKADEQEQGSIFRGDFSSYFKESGTLSNHSSPWKGTQGATKSEGELHQAQRLLCFVHKFPSVFRRHYPSWFSQWVLWGTFWMRKWTFRDAQISSASGCWCLGQTSNSQRLSHNTDLGVPGSNEPTLIYKTPKWTLDGLQRVICKAIKSNTSLL